MEWLLKEYPKAFNFKNKIPLKIRILLDLLKVRPDHIVRKDLQTAIYFYTSRFSYLRAVVSEDHRIDLNGDKAGEVKESHKLYSQSILDKKEKAIEKKAIQKKGEHKTNAQ